MKKVCMMLAAFGAFALVAGEKLDVNGNFAGSEVGAKEPKGWVYNTSTKPVGTGEVVKAGDELGVKIVNPKGALHYFVNKFFPVAASETYEVSVDATGTGVAGVGIYYYNEKGWVRGVYSKPQKLADGENKVTAKFTVPEDIDGKKPTKARFAFMVPGQGEVVFKNFVVEKEGK